MNRTSRFITKSLNSAIFKPVIVTRAISKFQIPYASINCLQPINYTKAYYATEPKQYKIDNSSMSESLKPSDVTYDELVKLLANPKKELLLIDVREPDELKETGKIDGAINIPLGEISNALKDFTEKKNNDKYGLNKILEDSNTKIVFHCMKGKRSKEALDIAHSLGLKQAKHYIGGYEEWVNKQKTN